MLHTNKAYHFHCRFIFFIVFFLIQIGRMEIKMIKKKERCNGIIRYDFDFSLFLVVVVVTVEYLLCLVVRIHFMRSYFSHKGRCRKAIFNLKIECTMKRSSTSIGSHFTYQHRHRCTDVFCSPINFPANVI